MRDTAGSPWNGPAPRPLPPAGCGSDRPCHWSACTSGNSSSRAFPSENTRFRPRPGEFGHPTFQRTGVRRDGRAIAPHVQNWTATEPDRPYQASCGCNCRRESSQSRTASGSWNGPGLSPACAERPKKTRFAGKTWQRQTAQNQPCQYCRHDPAGGPERWHKRLSARKEGMATAPSHSRISFLLIWKSSKFQKSQKFATFRIAALYHAYYTELTEEPII